MKIITIYIFAPNIIKIMKSSRVRREGLVTCMRQKFDTAFPSQRTKERDCLEDKDIVGRKTYCQMQLKEIGQQSVIWILLCRNMYR
jgi:hypothetical protein